MNDDKIKNIFENKRIREKLYRIMDDEHSMSHIHLTRDDIIGSHNWKGDIDLLNIAPLGIAEDLLW